MALSEKEIWKVINGEFANAKASYPDVAAAVPEISVTAASVTIEWLGETAKLDLGPKETESSLRGKLASALPGMRSRHFLKNK
jgi:hypothetical protein